MWSVGAEEMADGHTLHQTVREEFTLRNFDAVFWPTAVYICCAKLWVPPMLPVQEE